MTPGTLPSACFGSLAGLLAALGTSEQGATQVRGVFTILGFSATAAVTIMVSRFARKALDHRV